MCSVLLREEQRLRVFKSKMLKKMHRAKREEVTGGQRKLHGELHDLHSLQNIVLVTKLMRTRQSGHVACVQNRNTCRALVRKPEGK